jgi:hypothetical protein
MIQQYESLDQTKNKEVCAIKIEHTQPNQENILRPNKPQPLYHIGYNK